MLKPYICVVCEKVIFAQDLVPSLISLFTKIVMTVPIGAPEIPKNAVAPKEWSVFSSWETEPGDELREYTFCAQILYPDQSPFGEVNRQKISVEPNKRAQLNYQVLGFPIGHTGVYTIKAWIEEKQKIVVGPIDLKVELEVVKQSLG